MDRDLRDGFVFALRIMTRLTLLVIGCLAMVLALVGALLPGLPGTVFFVLALWAFARSSEKLHAWIMRLPPIKSALVEARRFKRRRTLRPEAKYLALAAAWGSVVSTAIFIGKTSPLFLLMVVAAAIAATAFVLVVPTEGA